MTERIFSLMQRMVLTNNHTLYVRSVIRLKNVHNKYPCLSLEHITNNHRLYIYIYKQLPKTSNQQKTQKTISTTDHLGFPQITDYEVRTHITGAADDLSTLPVATSVAQTGEILQFSVAHDYFVFSCGLCSDMLWLTINHNYVMHKGMKNMT